MAVLPVDPTYARTLSRLLTVMATMYDMIMMNVVRIAKRTSPISVGAGRPAGTLPLSSEWRVGDPREEATGVNSWHCLLTGRHLSTASSEARQGCTWRG